MRAEAASKRSIKAIRRLKIPTDGMPVAVAVFDMGILPFRSMTAGALRMQPN